MIQFRTKLLILLAGITMLIPAGSRAQSVSETKEKVQATPFELIEEMSEGKITFEIPETIEENLLSEPEPTAPKSTQQKTVKQGRMDGYRIQVFSDGRNQSSLQARAKARGSAIVARFPKYRGQVYTFSKSPNWYTRVGNFATQQEAAAAMAELRRAFPQFSSEMRVVKSQVTIRK